MWHLLLQMLGIDHILIFIRGQNKWVSIDGHGTACLVSMDGHGTACFVSIDGRGAACLVSIDGHGAACLVLGGVPQHLKANQWMSQTDEPTTSQITLQ